MSLLLKIVDAKGAERRVEVQPGAAIAIQPGDTVTLADAAQAAGIQFARSGNNLVITYGEGQVDLTGFYAVVPAGMAAPEFDVSLPDRPVIQITPGVDLTQVNLDAAVLSSALYDSKLSGLELPDAVALPEDQSGLTNGSIADLYALTPLTLSRNTPPPTPPTSEVQPPAVVLLLPLPAQTSTQVPNLSFAGTPGADVLVGGPGNDNFSFLNANWNALDTITGQGGIDVIRLLDQANVVDSAFTLVTSVENLVLGANIGGQSVTLGPLSDAAGLVRVDASAIVTPEIGRAHV